MLFTVISYLIPVASLVFIILVLLKGFTQKTKDVTLFRIFVFVLLAWQVALMAADTLNDTTHSFIFLRIGLALGSFAPAVFFCF
jgi:uncharacterized membrane protein YwaF